MAQENKMQMPGVFGGLMRYDDEYKSKFMISPAVIIGFVVAIVLFVLIAKLFFPIAALSGGGGGGSVPTGHGGVIWPLLGALI
jgi:preprotein translocase subunit Sec61beta